ncbi:DUF3667 domain-containing protein [Robertkochia aurantiaca]|uniref:DUF3667 domain-containing protein n=1 Tax=Robertkochia aurantiaca TaxID=2873700 RepID=UPI001CC9EC09|nr:DUF3667 domain-containing protein [Robertkochia sp. 3YJGBD-33]
MTDKPVKSEKSPFKYRGEKCLNCEHPLELTDRYCPHCGQKNTKEKITLAHMIDEFFSSFISYDSKLRRTLADLIFKPGKITEEYIAGKRASYTNPFRFLLSLAIIYFLMINYSSDLERIDREAQKFTSETDSLESNSPILFSFDDDELEQLPASDSLNKALDSLDKRIPEIKARARVRDSLMEADPAGYYQTIGEESYLQTLGDKLDFFQRGLKNNHYYTAEEAEKYLNTEFENQDLIAFRFAKSVDRVTSQPGSFLQEVISRLPFIIFFFLPVFAVFIWLIYSKKKYDYMDHLIFSFHTQSLFILLLMVAFLFEWISGIDITWIALLAFLFYLYKSMRRFYKERRFKTIVKYIFLNTIFIILAGTALIFFLIGSALTY